MLEGCSEACPAHVALQLRVYIETKLANRHNETIRISLFYCAVPLFSAIRKQAIFFPNVTARTEQKIAI